MSIAVSQTPVQLYLAITDGVGDVKFSERFDIASVSELPSLPDVGEQWNLIIEGTNYGATTVTYKRVTSQAAGNAFTTQIHITAVQ